ncbi:pantetheine-phosphate adenylyltransferase [Candidatus Roizmanbacteria bacterium]|nr:pantetheine-phosphate adenylyltransferase [Candidatus Roizmanbacteria bacterium]
MQLKPYRKVAVGGTFDRLHKGHEELLIMAFSVGDRVVIGLTDDQMIASKTLSELIEPYEIRKKHLELFLKAHRFLARSTIIRLSDSFGPALTDNSIQAVVIGPRVSEIVISKIQKIKPVISCKTILASDGLYLSSTRIRKGRVMRDGTVYALTDVDLKLPEPLRKTLKKPLGDRIEQPTDLKKKKTSLLISVGDASAVKLISYSIKPAIVVLDGMIQKKKVFTEEQIRRLVGSQYQFIRTTNLAGNITVDLVRALKKALDAYISQKKRTVIFIRGEDDLAVLPAVYLAPLESRVLYGQPPLPGRSPKPGLISITVSEKSKNQIGKLLEGFSSENAQ